MRLNKTFFIYTLAVMMTACRDHSDQADEAAGMPDQALPVVREDACAPEGALTYLCGLLNPEDLLLLGDSGRILASGMDQNGSGGHLYLINPEDDSFAEIFPATEPVLAQDMSRFPQCPGPLNIGHFSAHGLALREYAEGRFDLYMTSHGEREAIEIFDLNARLLPPAVTWKGCVVLPDDTFANSVAILPDGGFLTTKMMDPGIGFAPIMRGEITGYVLEWHPGEAVKIMPGSELSGANGIAVSEDGRYVYVAAMGGRRIVRFDRSENPALKAMVSVDILPDNIRWQEGGKLITAGGDFVDPAQCQGEDCAAGWSLVEIDAQTLIPKRVAGAGPEASIQGVSTALALGDYYWVGTYNGDRVAYLPK